jgi:hypothetical protein
VILVRLTLSLCLSLSLSNIATPLLPSQRWLEKSASELVNEPPAMNKYSQMNTMNPDRQIGAKGAFYKLDNDLDNSDQESLMKVSLFLPIVVPPSPFSLRSSGNASAVVDWIMLWRSL